MQKREMESLPAKAACGWLLLAIAAGISDCSQGGAGGPSAESPPVLMSIGLPKVIRVEDTLTAVGTIGANESVELRAEAAGRIEAIRFIKGQRVQAGGKKPRERRGSRIRPCPVPGWSERVARTNLHHQP